MLNLQSLPRNLHSVLLFHVAVLMLLFIEPVIGAQGTSIVEVNGNPITEQDLQIQFLTRNIPSDQQAGLREQFLNDLIDQRLMQEYLQEQKVKLNETRVQESLSKVYKIIREANRDPEEVLQNLGLTEQMLRKELMLPLAWEVHMEQKVTPELLHRFYEKNQNKFDGTELRLRQIFLKVNTIEEEEPALHKLDQIRQQIVSGQLPFEEAAQRFSQAPTAKNGGDLGFVPYQGQMPITITAPAFERGKGELTAPFLSPFGAHLIQVIDVKPGELSLEDVRTEVWQAMSETVWNNIITARRETAEIKWAGPSR
ncbi:MAG: peptidylprolyl isomerase [Planctomycetaceae bacterium]